MRYGLGIYATETVLDHDNCPRLTFTEDSSRNALADAPDCRVFTDLCGVVGEAWEDL
jgi:hypothetical protein